MKGIYTRTSERVCFIAPSIAIGVDVDGRWFLEAAWLWFAVGIGDAP